MVDFKLLKAKRKELKLKQVDIAQACGVAGFTVTKWENGYMKPTEKHLKKWGKSLGM